jgi:RNA polymerase sigma factor (sigma-70 family)
MKESQAVKKVKEGHAAKADKVDEAKHGASVVADKTASDELPEEDPEHHTREEVFDIKDVNVNVLLANAEFKRSLNIVCKAVFGQFGASPRYGEWEDLSQEVLMRLDPWLHKYKGTATLKSVLNRIATNLCIDEFRRQDAQIRAHVEIDFEEINLETLRSPFAEDIDARILFAECRNRLSGVQRVIFDEFFTEGRTLTEIAHRHNFSPQTAVNKMFGILKELRQFVAGWDSSRA